MKKSIVVSVAAVIVIVGSAKAQNVSTQLCDGKDAVGYIGISGIDCNCTISSPGSKRPWSFRTEPIVTSLEMDSPAGKVLKPGDVITHVNGKLITTSEGARELARIKPGEAVVLGVRRNGQSMKFALTAASTCATDTRLLGIYAPSVGTPGVAPPSGRAPGVLAPSGRAPRATTVTPRPDGVYGVAPRGAPVAWSRGSFGMGLSCSGNCSIRVRENEHERSLSFSQPPEVYSIERGGPADKAGIRRGDIITHINGNAMDSEEGGKLFANAKPGQTVRFTVQRDATRKTFTVRAEQRSTPMPQLAQSSASLEKARAALTELQRGHTEQLRRMEAELRKSRRSEEEQLQELHRELVRQEQEHRQKLAALSKELTHVHNRVRAAMSDSARSACSVAQTTLRPGATVSTLRYTGTVGGTEIEVRGANPVSVTESGDEVEIAAGGTTVRLKSTKKK